MYLRKKQQHHHHHRNNNNIIITIIIFPYVMTYTLPKLTYPLKINGFLKINFPFDTVPFLGTCYFILGVHPGSWPSPHHEKPDFMAPSWLFGVGIELDKLAIFVLDAKLRHLKTSNTKKKWRISSWCHLFWGHESMNLQVISGLDKNGAPNKRDMGLRVRQQFSSHNVLRWGRKSHQCKNVQDMKQVRSKKRWVPTRSFGHRFNHSSQLYSLGSSWRTQVLLSASGLSSNSYLAH